MRFIAVTLWIIATMAAIAAALWMFHLTYILSAARDGSDKPFFAGLGGFAFLFLATLCMNQGSKSLNKD